MVYAFFQGCLEVKIFKRMKKLQKPKCLAGTLEGEGGPSKSEKQKTKMHTWSEQPDMPEGELLETLRAYANENREEVKRNPKKQKLHEDFMDKTFILRRHDILTAPKLVKDVLIEYPLLKNFIHVRVWLNCVSVIH